jgi:hypothetical protein
VIGYSREALIFKQLSLLYTFQKPEHADEFREHCRQYNLKLVSGETDEARLYQVDVRWINDSERPIDFFIKVITESRFFTAERRNRNIFAHRELRDVTPTPEAAASAKPAPPQRQQVSYRRG